jgi:serine/threonine protein kinase
MEREQWLEVKSLVSRLIDLPRDERQAYLLGHCDHPVIRAEVRALVAEFESEEFEDFPHNDRFLPRRRLGSGGFGSVFEAYDREQEIVLALKVLRQKDPASLDRFKREFWTLREVDHPNLVKLYQLFQDRRWYFTMQLIRGVSFIEYLRTPLAVDQSVEPFARLRSCFIQLCRGVQALHDSGKLHRDLKPDNILVSQTGTVTLIDLGMARDFSLVPVQQSFTILGSPHYLSPEQSRAGTLTQATDWYSVGVILFEALTGKYPFDGDIPEIIEQKRHQQAPEASSIATGVPPDLSTLCRDLLQREASFRPGGQEILLRLGDASNTIRPSAINRSPFVGRDAILHKCMDLFNLCQTSRRCVLVNLRGKSGIGKSTLLRKLEQQVAERWPSAVWLAGRCHESARVRFNVLDPIMDRVAAYLKTLLPLEVKSLLPRDTASLVRLFPALKQVDAIARVRLGGIATLDTQELRDHAFEALIEFLGRMGEASPVVVCIDDVQWADNDSAAFFRHLFNHTSPPNLLIVTSGRSEDLTSSQFLGTLASLSESNDRVEVVNLELAELSAGETRRLALELLSGRQQPDDIVSAIIRQSDGIPFLVVEFSHYAMLGASENSKPDFTLDDVMRQRALALPAAARTLLNIVAAAGQPVPEIAAYKAAQLESDDFPGLQSLTIDNLVRVRETPQGRELETYHDRYREAVLNALAPEARRQAHYLLATALAEHSKPDPAFIANQFRMARENEQAARYFLIAAECATAELAFDQASESYRLARELWSYSPDENRRLAALHGEALVYAGHGIEAAMVFQESADKASSPLERLEFQRRAAEQLLRSGNINEGMQLVRKVAQTLGIWVGDKTWQTMLSILCSRVMVALRGSRIRLKARESISSADLAILDTYWSLAVGLSLVDMIRAFDFSSRHFVKALRVGDPQRIALSLALQAGHINLPGNRGSRAETLLVRAREIATVHNQRQVLALVEAMGAVSSYLAGDWRESYRFGVRGEGLLRSDCVGARWEVVSACIFSLKSLIWMGDWATYAKRLPPLLSEARSKGDRYAVTGLLLLTHAYMMDLINDDSAAARRGIRDALAEWSQEGFHLQDFFACFGAIEADLYDGLGPIALERVNEMWSRLKDSLLLRGQVVRIFALHLRARCRLAAAADLVASNPAKASQLVRDANEDIGLIVKTEALWGCALAGLLRAGVNSVTGSRDKCLIELAGAETALAEANMNQYSAAAQWRRGQLLGGATGEDLVHSAYQRIVAHGAKAPQRMVGLLAPGKWEAPVTPLHERR